MYTFGPVGGSPLCGFAAWKGLQDEAIRLYHKAANQGEPKAQYNLAYIYDVGSGVPQDHKEAARWYSKAAKQGIGEAKVNLSYMYYEGDGVPQDYVLAYMFAALAASQGRENGRKNRDALANMMTADEIRKAKQMARDWMAQHP
jgi:TPR repeat protein